MKRIIVVGMPGSGKTTLAKAIAAKCNIKHIEMDAIRHLANWQANPRFEEELRAAGESAERWVADGNYHGQGAVAAVYDLADTLIWLDFPKWLCLWRVSQRSIVRGVTQKPLWNGNRESLREFFLGKESMARWVWARHAKRRELYTQLRRENAFPHLQWIKLNNPREVKAWLADLTADAMSERNDAK